MSSRNPLAKGGFLNNVDGVIDITFLVGETSEIKRGERKGEPFTPLSLVLGFLQDGADEKITKRLMIGAAEKFGDPSEDEIVSEDGARLNTPDGQRIPASSEAGMFIASLLEAGFDVERLPEDDDYLDFSAANGTRVRLVSQTNEERTKRQGKDKNPKTGKEYDRKDILVATIHEMPEVEDAPAPAKSGKGKTVASVAGKKTKAPSIADKGAAALKSVLEANDGSLSKNKAKAKVLTALGKDEQRDEVLAWLFKDENLEGIDGVSYDRKDKAGMISLD